MRKLPKVIESCGWTFTQIHREGPLAIYEQSRDGKVFAYEVIVIRVAPPAEFDGHLIPEREVYPSGEHWGTYGWTCTTPERAFERFKALQALTVAQKTGSSANGGHTGAKKAHGKTV